MEFRPTVIERAFALAATGQFNDIQSIRKALLAEGFSVNNQLMGRTLTDQLRKVMAGARPPD
jgi:hypothetical protein